MENLVLIVHVLAALAIIGLILLQQGKGASMGASFGSGASQTVFGSSGGGHFLVKVTAVIAVLFFVTSFSLAVIAKRRAAPETEVVLPGFEDVPAIEQPLEDADSAVPVFEETGNGGAEVPGVEATGDIDETVPAIEDTSEADQDSQ